MASSTVYSFAAGVVVVVVRRIPLDTSEVKPSSRTPLPSTPLRPPLCGPGEVPSHSARRDPEDTKSTDSNSSLSSTVGPPPPPLGDDDRPPPPRDLLFSFSSSSSPVQKSSSSSQSIIRVYFRSCKFNNQKRRGTKKKERNSYLGYQKRQEEFPL